MGQTADSDRSAPGRESLEKAHRVTDFGLRRPAIRRRLARTVWMGRDDIPEQHVGLELELGERPVDDRRGRLGRAGAGELALRREGQTTDARAAVAGCFADEQVARVSSPVQIGVEALAPQLGIGVLVERVADVRRGQSLDEASH